MSIPGSAGAGRDGRLQELEDKWRVRASKWRARRSGRGKAEVCDDCADELAAILAVPDPLASETEKWAEGIDVLMSVNQALHAVGSSWRIDLQRGQAIAVPVPDCLSPLASSSEPQGESKNETKKI